MPVIPSRLKADGLALVVELQEITGASTSAIMAALVDYLAIYHKDEIMDFILHRVEFYTKGFRFKRKPPQK